MLQGEETQASEATVTIVEPEKPALTVTVDRNRNFAFQMSIRRVRLALGALAVLSVLGTLIVLCASNGLLVGRFNPAEEDQKLVIDRYNSISGNIMSAIEQPLNFFVSAVTAVAILMTGTNEHRIRHEIGRLSYFRVTTIVVASTLVYLLQNGISSLNVQAVPGPIQFIISDADIIANPNDTAQEFTEKTTVPSAWSERFAESVSHNSILNTILRTSVQPTDYFHVDSPGEDGYEFSEEWIPPPSVAFGYPVRQWQSRLLSRGATPSASLQFDLNETAKIDDSSLPMDVKMATNLFVKGMKYLGVDSNIPFWSPEANQFAGNKNATSKDGHGGFQDGPKGASSLLKDKDIETFTFIDDHNREKTYYQVADYFKLTSATNNGTGFVHSSTKLLRQILRNASVALSRGYSHVEYNHFDLADDISFDSMTLEFSRMLNMSTSTTQVVPNSTDVTSVVDATRCSANGCLNPWIYEADWNGNETAVNSFVRLARICQDEDETLLLDDNGYRISCGAYSNSSMLVFSLGRRLVGDTWDLSSDSKHKRCPSKFTNLRFVYSFTIGRLAWQTRNLSDEFDASCAASVNTKCDGLWMPLDSKDRMLLVSASKLPTQTLSENARDVMWVTNDFANMSQQILLPRNFGQVTDAMQQALLQDDCFKRRFVPYIFAVERNHIYMEQSLQVAYTIGLFFLFQSGVVVPIVTSTAPSSRTAIPLEFSSNKLFIDMMAVVPTTSAVLCVVGCVLLALTVVAVLLLGSKTEQELQSGATSQVVTTALMNEKIFPPLLLDMALEQASGQSDGTETRGRLDQFVVAKAVFELSSDDIPSDNANNDRNKRAAPA